MTKLDTSIEKLSIDQIGDLVIANGAHAKRGQALCSMEIVAWLAGEPHGDSPNCTCPVIASFVRSWNDGLPDESREKLLRPVLPRLLNTRSSKAVEARRSYLALDWLIRVHTPEWLSLREDLKEHAATLRGLSPVLDLAAAQEAGPKVRAARAATRADARAAARDAAWIATRAAAWDAAWAAAWIAAGAAAWAAARAAAWEDAWDAAWAAAKADAGKTLAPTVQKLQVSAGELLERMIVVGEA